MENEIENLDSTNEEVQVDTVETTETETTEVDVSKVLATNKKLFARLKATETELKKFKVQPKEVLSTNKAPDFDPLVDTLSAIKDLSADELKELSSEARSLGIEPVKYIKSTSGQTLLKDIQRKNRSKDASESIPGKSPVFKKHTMEDFSKMTVAEMEKTLSEAE